MVETAAKASATPLAGIKVVEFSHMIMGPSCGLVLADLGADVVKIEPAPKGDNSRRLSGIAAGFFQAFNRNKRSLCVDMKSDDGRALVRSLIAEADVVVENFRPGAMDKLGLGPAAMMALNPRLIYCSCKGFLPGPYQHRAALDEVVQMMGGLAYMTGPPGKPMRAGTSINDILGGVFGSVAVLAALRERDRTGIGGAVQSGLFETNALLVAQHMAVAAVTGSDPLSFGDPDMKKPWPLYDVFDTCEPGQQLFVGVVTETQWRNFCEAFDLTDLRDDPTLSAMKDLAAARPRIAKRVAAVFGQMTKQVLSAKCEALGLPFAPIARPSDLFDDPHLLASGGLLATDMTTARDDPAMPPHQAVAGLPTLPITFDEARVGLRRQPPRVGQHSIELAREAGLTDVQIDKLIELGVLTVPAQPVDRPPID